MIISQDEVALPAMGIRSLLRKLWSSKPPAIQPAPESTASAESQPVVATEQPDSSGPSLDLGGAFEAIMAKVIEPTTLEFCEEVSQQVSLLVVGLVRTKSATEARFRRNLVVGAGAEGSAGEVRVLFKDDEVPSRYEAEAIIRGLAPGSGFSGFNIRGRVSVVDGAFRIRESAQVNRYNTWEWRKEFVASR